MKRYKHTNILILRNLSCEVNIYGIFVQNKKKRNLCSTKTWHVVFLKLKDKYNDFHLYTEKPWLSLNSALMKTRNTDTLSYFIKKYTWKYLTIQI